jgi:hypothetical protein
MKGSLVFCLASKTSNSMRMKGARPFLSLSRKGNADAYLGAKPQSTLAPARRTSRFWDSAGCHSEESAAGGRPKNLSARGMLRSPRRPQQDHRMRRHRAPLRRREFTSAGGHSGESAAGGRPKNLSAGGMLRSPGRPQHDNRMRRHQRRRDISAGGAA